VGTSVEGDETIVAAFFDLDKTIISRSSTLAFGPSFYRHGLISRSQALRTAYAQVLFRIGGAGHQRMERLRLGVGELCRGWPADRVSEIVRRHLHETILPLVYAEAERLIAAHGRAGQDVIIVSTSGQEMVGPIGDLLGACEVIATRMEVADGRYTGEMEFWAYGEAKARRVRELAAKRGYRLPDCYAYSDSITDLPMLEAVGHPRAVNPDRALRRIARERHWPVLAFGTRSPADRAGIGQRSAAAVSLLGPAAAGTEVSPASQAADSRPRPPARRM
jgi:HAD superfamily hydrolase (TIGR01490 family)